MAGLPTDELPEKTDDRENTSDDEELSKREVAGQRSYYYDDAFGYRDYDPSDDVDDRQEDAEDEHVSG